MYVPVNWTSSSGFIVENDWFLSVQVLYGYEKLKKVLQRGLAVLQDKDLASCSKNDEEARQMWNSRQHWVKWHCFRAVLAFHRGSVELCRAVPPVWSTTIISLRVRSLERR